MNETLKAMREFGVFCVLGTIIGAILGLVAIISMSENSPIVKNVAAQHGCGKFFADEVTGHTSFVWNDGK